MIRPRKKLRRGEPTPEEKAAARIHCRERAHAMCELRCSPECRPGPLPLHGDLFTRGELSHLLSKRRFGWMENDKQKHRWSCHWCHAYEHAGKKPCPPKN